jgi:hypothetical protein
VVFGAAVALAGCHAVSVQLNGPTAAASKGSGGSSSRSSSSSSSSSSSVQAAGPLSAGSGALTVLSEPQAGLSKIYQLITGARSSIELTMYTLRDTTAQLLPSAGAHLTQPDPSS